MTSVVDPFVGVPAAPEPPQRPRRRRWLLVALLCLVALAPVIVVTGRLATRCTTQGPVATRAVSDLDQFTGWLRRNQVRGYVGEVGWPAGKAWNAVAQTWFDHADTAHLWVTVWAAGAWWPKDYPMAAIRLSRTPGRPAQVGAQGRLLAGHSGPGDGLRGVALPSGSFGAGRDGIASYSSARPGRYGRDYYYEDALDFRQLARTGVDLVRLSFSWERVQPVPGGPLDPRAVALLRSSLAAAAAAGVGVILDLHNYGDFWEAAGVLGHRRLVLGTPALPLGSLGNVWGRLSRALSGATSLIGYDLMNEPSRMGTTPAAGARAWERASQLAVVAIRAAGGTRTVFVSGYGGASPRMWPTYHPRAWIRDPDNQVRYEAHQYFDSDRTGRYAAGFAQEERSATHAGYAATCGDPTASAHPIRAPVTPAPR